MTTHYINSYCRLSLLLKCHYNVLIHNYCVFTEKMYSSYINFFVYYWFLRFPECLFLLLFLVIAVIVCLVLVRETYIRYVYNINMSICFNYFKSFYTCTYISTIFYFIILTIQPPNYLIRIFTHLKLCLADAIHNFK